MDHLVTLILSRHLAQHEGLDQAGAIYHTSKMLLNEVDKKHYELFWGLSRSTTAAYKRVEAVKKLEIGLRSLGYL